MTENKKTNYKDTLNLPKTSFDMRAGLLKKEPSIQKKWKDENLTEEIARYRAGGKRFILHDGPPYANGDIHVGTAMNKILKDMVVRIRTMEGFDAPYIPGWDCHGLPIEQKVMDELGGKALQMSSLDIRKICRKYAEGFSARQSEQFQRLGVNGRFSQPYITMKPKYESDVLEVFARLVEQGVVFRQLKPVHWSIENRTALADAELEYKDREDPSIYVAFDLAAEGLQNLNHPALNDDDKVGLLIWTTTPWTLPANLAVAVHPKFTYQLIRCEIAGSPRVLIIAESRAAEVLQAIGDDGKGCVKNHQVIASVTGKELLDAEIQYNHPLCDGKVCPVVSADYVTLEDGTGLVHTAPGHGLDDYLTGLKFGLDIYCPVQEDGTFDNTAPDWLEGMNVRSANAKIVEHLKSSGLCLHSEMITHSYPHDWRSKTPTIFRATEQWFIGVDKPLKKTQTSLRDTALDICSRSADDGGVDFYPKWGQNRMTGMLTNRPDWCISRQRVWGLPIPAFTNETGQTLLTPASVRAVAKVFEADGSDAWFTKSPEELLEGWTPDSDPDIKNPRDYQPRDLKKQMDIFDVWFESGSSWYAVAIAEELVDEVPVDLYLEGSDQHRGWFQLSLLPAIAATGKAPFKSVVTHGFIVDENGKKMSKSEGNFVSVIDQLKKRGADILRLYIASLNYQDDVKCSDTLISQAEEAYRKIRNTFRFAMGACGDFDPAHHSAEPAGHSIDRWMRLELQELIRSVTDAYDNYEFHKAARILYEFCTVQASSIYFSAVKDRLYCEAQDAPARQATQTVIHEILLTLVKLYAPILVHTCEEAWEHIPFRDSNEPSSVHLADMPKFDSAALDQAESMRVVATDNFIPTKAHIEEGSDFVWSRLLELRSEGLVKLEHLRNSGVKNSLDAEIVFKVSSAAPEQGRLIEMYLSQLEDMLGVGFARMETRCTLPVGVTVEVRAEDTREKYARCARSWKRRPDVGSDANYPDLSARDAAVMKKIG